MSDDRFTLTAIDSLVEAGMRSNLENHRLLRDDGLILIYSNDELQLVLSEEAWSKMALIRNESDE